MALMIPAWSVYFHASHSDRSRTSQISPKGITCMVATPSTFRCRISSRIFLAVSSLVVPKSRFLNSSVATLNDIVSAITMPLITLMNLVLAILWSDVYCLTWVQLVKEQDMEIICAIAVIYVTFDLAASAYVVIKRGGIKATIADIRQNLGLVRDTEEEDVHDQW